jgi:hypothetical protein
MGSEQRLRDKITELEARQRQLSQKLSGLQAQSDGETRKEEKLRLELPINETKSERDQVEQELRWLESQRSGNDRYSLTIRLQLANNQLVRRYFDSSGKITEYRSPWQHRFAGTQDGAVLYEILFGPPADDQSGKVLRVLCNSDTGVEPAPIRYPLRVRIHTTDPQLAALPWSHLTWQGQRLCKTTDWTFELTAVTPESIAPLFPDVTLRAPCTVLMIAPPPPATKPDSADSHYRGLEEHLLRAWPVFGGKRCQRVIDWPGLAQAFRQHKPRIVYYYGYAVGNGRELKLPLQSSSGSMEWRLLDSLTELWGNHPPQVMFFNLIDVTPTAVGTAMSRFTPGVPLIVTQTCPADHLHAARQATLKWFHVLLEGNEDMNPISALHQHGLETAIAWSGFGHWQTSTAREPPKEALARLLLDRKLQRGRIHQAVSELVQDRDRRLCCIITHGTQEDNLVELFPDQMVEYLRRHAQETVHIRRQRLHLPAGSHFSVADIEARVYRDLGLGPHDSLANLLGQRKPPALGRAHPLLFLDWGVRKSTEETGTDEAALAAWVEFCCQQLIVEHPGDLRLLSCLCLERPQNAHDVISKAVRELRKQFRHRAFRLELLEPLHDVDVDDLADFLGSGYSTCPDDLFQLIPELIIQRTKGKFAETVALIERAEQTSWYELHDELCQSNTPP